MYLTLTVPLVPVTLIKPFSASNTSIAAPEGAPTNTGAKSFDNGVQAKFALPSPSNVTDSATGAPV